jgi:hypothetical protein
MAGNGRRKGDDALVLALASGQTVRDAACAAGVGERTATRRWADPDFRRRVARRRAELAARAAGQLADGMAEAALTLRRLLAADAESVRLAAARSILEVGHRLRDAVEVEERLREVEERLDAAAREGTP